MASLKHDHFQVQLEALVQLHESEHDRDLARSALMWLSISERPLRVHEIWIAIQVVEDKAIEGLLTKTAYADDQKAASALKRLLRGLVSLDTDPQDSSKLIASLSDSELKLYLNHFGNKEVPPSWRSLAFTSAEAHSAAARVSMIICASTALRLAHIHDQDVASGLILYAWENWSTHLSLSGLSLAQRDLIGLADNMIFEVSIDILVFLLALNEFVTGPITFSATENRTESTALVKRIQELLEQPISLLSAVVHYEEFSQPLQVARQTFEAWKDLSNATDAQAMAGLSSMARLENKPSLRPPATSGSKFQALHIDTILREPGPNFGQSEKQMVQSFAEISRGLRSLTVALGSQPIYDEIVKQHASPWSPLDVLVNVANWMEAVASYPYWNNLQGDHTYNPLAVKDTSDGNDGAADPVRGSLQPSGRPQRPSVSISRDANAGTDVSWLRWQAASVLGKVKGFRKRSTFTINNCQSTSQRRSSLERIPPGLQALENPLKHIVPLMSLFIGDFRSNRAGSTLALSFVKPRDEIEAVVLTGGLAQSWPLLKSSIVADGHRTAVAYCGIAILLHQIRRMLFPWMGTYIWDTPLEDMRLALSNPDFFLDETLSFSWTWCLFMYGQKYVCDLLAGLAMRVLVTDNRREANPPATTPYFERLREVCKVGYIFWAFATIEYVLCRSINTVSFGLAYWKLLSGGDFEHLVLSNIAKTHWAKLPLNVWQLLYYVHNGLWPLGKVSVLCAAFGHPALLTLILAIAGAVKAILKYRSTFFIALEVSGFFIAVGLALLSAILLTVEFVSDPLGLKASTAKMRQRGSTAHRELPAGAYARIQILSRQAASRVLRPLPSRDRTKQEGTGIHRTKEE